MGLHQSMARAWSKQFINDMILGKNSEKGKDVNNERVVKCTSE